MYTLPGGEYGTFIRGEDTQPSRGQRPQSDAARRKDGHDSAQGLVPRARRVRALDGGCGLPVRIFQRLIGLPPRPAAPYAVPGAVRGGRRAVTEPKRDISEKDLRGSVFFCPGEPERGAEDDARQFSGIGPPPRVPAVLPVLIAASEAFAPDAFILAYTAAETSHM